MPHISKYKLSNSQIDELSQRVVDVSFLLRNREDLQSFFHDLLSTTEKVMLGKRLLIAVMLERGLSYLDIRQRLKVSDPTIGSVSERLKVGGRGFRAAIKQLERKEKIDTILRNFAKPLEKLEEAIRRLPKIAYMPRRRSL
ncbi:MAG: hypothetical protein HYT39_00855 [Candidatus Sungbacteria bacterium]|nr:hypothetical protein [Candidatus Sungbacteria bacterium]